MAKRRKYTRKRKKQPLNWKLILSSSVLLAALMLTYLALGDGIRDYLPRFENWKTAVSSFFEKLGDISIQIRPSHPVSGTAEVHFIDVGQGDSILIRSGESDILIDAGENDKGAAVNAYLDRVGAEELDLMIGTHPHSDHIGGLDDVIEARPVKELILPEIQESVLPTTRTFYDLLDAAEASGLKITPAVPGTVYSFGDGRLEILGPVADYEDLNDYSVVCRFDYGEVSFLLTGDMEQPAEADLLAARANVQADILKAGHHGSSTSTGEEFFQAVHPSVCVMQLGAGNAYNHPHRETVARLENAGVDIYRNDLDGTVVVTTDGTEWSIFTENQEEHHADRGSD